MIRATARLLPHARGSVMRGRTMTRAIVGACCAALIAALAQATPAPSLAQGIDKYQEPPKPRIQPRPAPAKPAAKPAEPAAPTPPAPGPMTAISGYEKTPNDLCVAGTQRMVSTTRELKLPAQRYCAD